MKDVLITIKGTQEYEGDADVIEMMTVGTLEESEGNCRLIYKEDDESGGTVTTTLTVCDKMVTLERSGALNSRMIIEQGQRHICHYDTGFGELMIGVFGESICSTLDREQGNLSLKYTIDINAALASRNEIAISVKEAQQGCLN